MQTKSSEIIKDEETFKVVVARSKEIFECIMNEFIKINDKHDSRISYHVALETSIAMLAFVIYMSEELEIELDDLIELIANKALARSKINKDTLVHEVPTSIQ